jgi:ubiquinone/menaquinone biosynthesis C-methylase UbiE
LASFCGKTCMEKWTELKQSHKSLSAAAASTYDEIYQNSNHATGIYMRYEEDMIHSVMKQLPQKAVSAVLGSGTGRESFALANYFDKVFGLDFSPEMTAKAQENQKKLNVKNTFFMTLDVEHDPLPFPNQSVDFINSSFGMGSFVLNPANLFLEIKRVLKPEGRVIFSFYNSQAFINQLDLGWKPAISSRLNHEEKALEVQFGGQTYFVPVVPYSVTEIKVELDRFFTIHSITTFPSISSIFPQELFENERVRKLCLEADLFLADNLELAGGPFIVTVVGNK